MQSNLTLTLGFKGQGTPNGVPAAVPNGVWTLGGYQDANDTYKAKFGVVMSSDPNGGDGDFKCGALVTAGAASVYTGVATGTAALAGNINVDGVVVALPSGAVASGVAALILAQAASFSRFNVTASGTTGVVFTSKTATYQTAPTYSDSSSTGVTLPTTVTTSGTYGSVARGITIYDGGVAQLDPAKPDYIIQGAPITVAYRGQMWLKNWIGASTWAGGTDGLQTGQDSAGVVCTGALATPVLGSVVVASNVTGEIGFLASGSGAPTGYTVISAVVKSVSLDTNGIMIFVNL